MFKKISKYVLWLLLGLFALGVPLAASLYLPPVQRLATGQIESYARRELGLQLELGRLRLGFPLNLRVDSLLLRDAGGDTLLRLDRLRVQAALWPLLRGQVRVPQLVLDGVGMDYRDTLSGLRLAGSLERLDLGPVRVNLREQEVLLRRLSLEGGEVRLWPGTNPEPDTAQKETPAWRITAGAVDLSRVAFEMYGTSDLGVALDRARAASLRVDLGEQQVALGRLRIEGADARYLTAPGTVPDTTAVADTSENLPWTILLERLDLSARHLLYGNSEKNSPTGRFDPQRIEVDSLELRLDSLYNRGAELSGQLRTLALRERSGLEVRGASGGFAFDTAELRLDDFSLTTPQSFLTLAGEADAALLRGQPEAPLALQLDARLAAADLFRFYPGTPSLRQTLRGQTLTLKGSLDGNLRQLDLYGVNLGMPGHITLNLDGPVRSLDDPARLGGDLRLRGRFTKLDFLKALIPDTALRRRIALPPRMDLFGRLAWGGGRYAPDLTLGVDTARMEVSGKVDLRKTEYEGHLSLQDFPLGAFLSQDSLGLATARIEARGRGFDPAAEGAGARIEAFVEQFEYRGYSYDSITLNASLEDHRLSGKLSSASEALQLNLGLQGTIRPGEYAARLEGRVGRLDLQRLGFVPDPLDGSFHLGVDAGIKPGSEYRAEVIFDSIRMTHNHLTDSLKRTALRARSGKDSTALSLRSGDLAVDFSAPLPLDSLGGALTLLGRQATSQLDSGHLDMVSLQEAMPPFRLDATAGRNNLIHFLLKEKNINFQALQASVATDAAAPFRATARVEGLQAGAQLIDTLSLSLRRREQALDYHLRLGNRPRESSPVTLIAASGFLEGNRAEVDLLQRDRTDSTGFRFSLEALLLDSALRLSLGPDPLFGYLPWTVNADNSLLLYRDRRIEGNLDLTHGSQYVRLSQATLSEVTRQALRVQMGGIDLGELLGLFPGTPPLAGRLSTDLTLGMDSTGMAIQGRAGVDSLHYNRQRVGDLALQLGFLTDSLRGRKLDADLRLDGKPVLTAGGTHTPRAEQSLDLKLDIPGLPLASLNAFLPADAARLTGTLRGKLHVGGSELHPLLDGSLSLDSATLRVPAAATSFGLSPEPFSIVGSQITFKNFGLVAPSGKRLALDGTLDLRDRTQPLVDLSVKASAFPLVNSPRNNNSMVYGKTDADIDLKARGKLSDLTVRGDLRLLSSTNMTYTLRQSPVEVKDQKQHIVTFVSFSDSAALARLDDEPGARIWGMDVQVGIHIEDRVRATVNLSEDGENRIALEGGGDLHFSMNPQGDTRFTGRYSLSEGTVVYNFPVVGQKEFQVQQGSYVDWRESVTDPTFNITAVESVQTSVSSDDQGSRRVTFEVTVTVRNSIKNMAIAFDLAAPQDLIIQNQLLALSPEQRSTQAIALLVYDTYTGPGTSAHLDANTPLNAFIEKEMNKWARNTLRSVDLSFGVQDVDDKSTGGNEHTDYSYKFSKDLFNDRVTVSIGGKVSSDATTSEDLRQNIVDDVSVEYRLSKGDNTYLKIYRYTTQPSIIEGDVTETGVGFVARKQLNKLGHLFRLRRTPDQKQQREEKKAFKKQLKMQQDSLPAADTLPQLTPASHE